MEQARSPVQPNVIPPVKADAIERRVFGKTGRTLPVVGFPCLALKNGDQKTATEELHRALDLGVDYFDVAPAYGKDGECEIKTGEGLKGMPRESYFLACKTQKDDAKEGRVELERSLKRLNTDHFDLYQLHCLQREDEVKQALGPGGVLEMILKAKEEGKVRHIGFSAHTTEAALAALDGFAFDSCMFPINFVEWFQDRLRPRGDGTLPRRKGRVRHLHQARFPRTVAEGCRQKPTTGGIARSRIRPNTVLP